MNLGAKSRGDFEGEFSIFTFFSPDLSFLFCTFSVIAVFVTTSAKSSSSTLKYGLLHPGRNLYPVKMKNTSVAISSLFTDFRFSKFRKLIHFGFEKKRVHFDFDPLEQKYSELMNYYQL